MNRVMKEVDNFLPHRIRSILGRSTGPPMGEIEEIRLRLGRPLALHGRSGEFFLSESGMIVTAAEAYRPDGADLERRCSCSAAPLSMPLLKSCATAISPYPAATAWGCAARRWLKRAGWCD